MRLVEGRDLATSRRIVDAGIDLFAVHGYVGTSVRTVAAAAGVSPGLVIQRFGDKAGCGPPVTTPYSPRSWC